MADRCPDNCPLCYANVRGRAAYPGHRGYRVPVSVYHWRTTMALKRPSASPTPPPNTCSIDWSAALPGTPLLAEFMFSPVYDDDSKRELPTLMLFLHDGRLTAALNDRDQARTAFVSGDSLASVLVALEAGIAADALGWRPNKPQSRKK
jgi:hypothetical protein